MARGLGRGDWGLGKRNVANVAKILGGRGGEGGL